MWGDAEGDPGRNGDAGRAADRGGPGEALRFQVLGPVRAWRDGRQLKLGSPQQRATLAVLLLRDGRPSPPRSWSTRCWGEEPPPRAVGTLRTYVSRLRALLEPDRRAREPARLLVSAGDGYALRVPRTALDACELEDRVAAARRASGAGRHAEAHEELTAALALSDGAPLAGLPGPYAVVSATGSPNCPSPPRRNSSPAPSRSAGTRRRPAPCGCSPPNTGCASAPRPC